MNRKLIHQLEDQEIDVDGALWRLSGNEALYESLLQAFLKDPTLGQLDVAIRTKDWDDAFTAAHALKGLAGNMGFVPLFHNIGELVVVIRAGRIPEISLFFEKVKCSYDAVVQVIRNHGAE